MLSCVVLKRVLVLLGVSLMLGASVFAQTNIPATPGAHIGGTLTIGIDEGISCLDPRLTGSGYDGYVLNEIYDKLITEDPNDLQPRPFIAKSWEVTSTGITFYINEGIKFHNGEDLTAEDVAYSLNWQLDPVNGASEYKNLQWLEKVVIVDDYTVHAVTKPGYASYMPALASLQGQSILPKDTLLEMGDDAFSQHPIGSGPYKFVEWKSGDHVTLERNENYWLIYPNLDKVIYRPIPELQVMILELESGGIDMTTAVPVQDIARLEKNPDLSVLQRQGLIYYYYFFNMSHEPSSDIRFRKAVHMSVDWDKAIFSIFQGLGGTRTYGAIPPTMWANDVEYLRDQVALKENDAEAKRIFAELKAEGVIPEDYTVKVYCPLDPRRGQLTTILVTNLKENGLDVEMYPLDWAPYISLIDRSKADPTAKELDMGIIGTGGPVDPNGYVYWMFHSSSAQIGAASNFAFYNNPKVDELIHEADLTPDQAKREALYVEAQRICFEDYVHIPAYRLNLTRGLNKRVHGYSIDPLENSQNLCNPYNNVWVEEK